MFTRRRVTHSVSVRRRPEALNAYRRVHSREYSRYALLIAAVLRTQQLSIARRDTLTRFLRVICLRYLDLTRFLRPPEPLVNRRRAASTIDLIESSEKANRYYGFDKNELHRILAAFDLPDLIRVRGQARGGRHFSHRFEKEELLLVFLQRYKMSTSFEVLADHYGKDASQWSRGFQWIVGFIVERHGHLLTNNLGYFVPDLARFAKAVVRRCDDVMDANTQTIVPPAYFDHSTFPVAGWIDCNVTQTRVPGTGPMEAGPNAQRRPNALAIGQAFYTGHKHYHGLKRELILFPNGMFAHCSPTYRAGTNDRRITAETEIAAQFEQVQEGHYDPPFCVYGDGLYVACRTVKRPHFPRNHISDRQKSENDVMKRVRVSIENAFGACNNNYPFPSQARNVRILNPLNQDYALIGYLLWNVHVCIHYSAINVAYGCKPPKLEDWINRRRP